MPPVSERQRRAMEAAEHGHSMLGIPKRVAEEFLHKDADPDGSVRHFDEFGRLHVRLTHISKANVCPYYGREIPSSDALGLDAEKIYYLYRDPAELEKGAATSNNIQVLAIHKGVDAENPQEKLVAGTTGTDAEFNAPFLDNSLTIWRQEDIDQIESEEKVELSCSYAYEPVMEPGTAPDGTRFDGRMTNIRFNHVALVPKGRAGSDVLVADALPFETRCARDSGDLFQLEKTAMPALSRKAQLAHGAIAAYVLPKLAADAKIDLSKVVKGAMHKNWNEAKPVIAGRLKDAARGKLAKDASLEDVVELLDRLDDEGVEDDEIDAMDESEEDKAKRMAAEKAAEDGEAETEEEKAERMKRRMEAKDKAARDAETDEDKMAREKMERDTKAKEAEDNSKAMDAAIKASVTAAVSAERAKASALRQAEHDVEPFIGKLPLAQDSAEAVYRLALDHLGVNLKDVPENVATYRAILMSQPKQGATKPRLAHDASASADFKARYPEAARIRA